MEIKVIESGMMFGEFNVELEADGQTYNVSYNEECDKWSVQDENDCFIEPDTVDEEVINTAKRIYEESK